MINTLKQGDTIGFFSPSSPVTYTCLNRFKRAQEFLIGKGYKLKAGRLTGKADFYRSGSIKERAEEFNELIRDPEVNCIISTIGGMNSNSILPYIDYQAFIKKPKIVIGYSDVTAILMALYAKTGIPTFYGPALVASFGEFEPFSNMSFKYFKDVLENQVQYPYEYEMPSIWTEEFIDWETKSTSKKGKTNEWLSIHDGQVTGRLIIGNLNTLSGIWGSEYMPQIKEGDILFIEDSLKDIAIIERSFALLKCNKVFDRIGGLILGKHEGFDDKGTNRRPYEVLEEVLGEYDFPFLAEVDCCHTHPMFTMPIGGTVTMDATNKKISLLHQDYFNVTK